MEPDVLVPGTEGQLVAVMVVVAGAVEGVADAEEVVAVVVEVGVVEAVMGVDAEAGEVVVGVAAVAVVVAGVNVYEYILQTFP